MKSKDQITIVDYGVGNLRSLIRAFELFGANVLISEDPKTLVDSDAIVLPGDGAFNSGMRGLRVRNLTQAVKDFAKSGKPILGICLGAQILLSFGFEFGKFSGLDLMKGKVIRFPKLKDNEKIPQIGWNSIFAQNDKNWKNTILENVKSGSNVYFIHSYIIKPSNKYDILALSTYGEYEFCSVIFRNNIYGCQFHPEKSGDVGLLIINNFLKVTNRNKIRR